MVKEGRADRELNGEMIQEVLEKHGIDKHVTQMNGDGWGRPLSCSGFTETDDDDNGDPEGNGDDGDDDNHDNDDMNEDGNDDAKELYTHTHTHTHTHTIPNRPW